MISKQYYIGCDVGTGSARAGIFDSSGMMISMHEHPIKIWRPKPDYVEQSSDDIWRACCTSVKNAINKADIDPKKINGIGFDATCSLVVLDGNDEPVTVSPSGSKEQNVIVWMDHRSIKEAESINRTKHDVLKYVGGRISPEMETPKLLWLKKAKTKSWEKAAKFFDLPDFLVYQATGVDVRSICTTTCKWTYLGHEKSDSKDSLGKWDSTYFNEIGLGDLVDENYSRIGQNIRPVGEPVKNGLTDKAAKEMGLNANIPVAVGIIDAHAGGLGLLGMELEGIEKGTSNLENHIALIGGTSSCHMAVSREPRFIDGVWGPYYSAMVPGMWLTEGGQSATGALIDHVIYSSKKSIELEKEAGKKEKTVYEILNERIYQIASKNNVSDFSILTRDLNVLPYFHGNRSPHANPSLVGSICGLKLSSTLDDLALLYLATIQAIAYGTRHIIETLNQHGYSIKKIMATGGGTKNEIFLKEHADACGCQIILPKENEAVLLGGAILGAVAGGCYSSIFEAMKNMNKTGRIINPTKGEVEDYHNAKYRVFHQMYKDELSYFKIMEKW